MGGIEPPRAVLWARLRCGRGRFGNDEVPQQHAAGVGLQRHRVDRQEVIAEGAFLLVTEQVGLEDLLAALRAGHDEGHGRRVAW